MEQSEEGQARIKQFTHCGGNGLRVPPVPIPNTEVKPQHADGTWLETARESRSLPDSIRKSLSFSWGFFLSNRQGFIIWPSQLTCSIVLGWHRSLPPPVAEAGRRSVGNRKERRNGATMRASRAYIRKTKRPGALTEKRLISPTRLCEFPGRIHTELNARERTVQRNTPAPCRFCTG